MLALHGFGWRHVGVTRHAGPISATLAYDSRGTFDDTQLRRATLLVRRDGAVVLARKLDVGGYAHASLVLRNVWGDPEPEALVELRACGNRCSYALYVGLPQVGNLAFHDFGVEASWRGQLRDGRFEFVTYDSRFFCTFTDCASSTMPVQVVAIDPRGEQFVDVSRSLPDLLLADSRGLWKEYLEERAHPYKSFNNSYNYFGTLVPYCADEYRLGVNAQCDRLLPAWVKRKLTDWGVRRAST